MALYTPLDDDDLALIAQSFGLPPPSRAVPEPKGGVNTNYHLWSGGERYFLRLNEGKRDGDVLFEGAVLRFLEEARFPAARLLLTPSGACFVPLAGRQAMIFGYAPGEEVARAAIQPSHCRRVGEQLGRLHELSSGFTEERENPYGVEWVAARLRSLEPDGRGDPEVAAALPVFREELDRAARLPSAPRGLVHGDPFAENVLWLGDRVSAVLDWEMACTAVFAYDLAVALNAWCYGDDFDPQRAAALLAGYRSKSKVDPSTIEALHALARFAALRFAVSRVHGYHLAELAADRLVKKDWRRYRDRLSRLREMGEAGFKRLIGA